MNKFLFVIFSIMVVLSGCGSSDPKSGSETPELLEVSINVPEEIAVDNEVALEAIVSQGKENVEDADEVKFEIRKVGEEDSEMITASHEGKGVYVIKKTFGEGGKYMVTAHVTARSMHNMPSEQITVEDPAAAEDENAHDAKEETEHEHSEDGENHSHGENSGGHDHHSDVTIEFNDGSDFKVNEKAVLSANINSDNQPLTKATVRFEVWFENEHNHEYVTAVEGSNGIYTSEKTFSKAGTYHIKVHVEKGEIHDHQENKIEVK
ncbi:FixH family protein [Mesobacillus subterraneus]|uniref:FixH family protein n=1 Tax=Mesobacillus subterraneus TaxID=285983 RepID=UPI001475625B|nr:FixH family protein [Mesobacillus subterraneus]